MPAHVTRSAPHSPALSSRQVAREAERMLLALGVAEAELSVLLTDDPTIATLNGNYRHKKGPTDVLAFPQEDAPANDRARTPRRSRAGGGHRGSGHPAAGKGGEEGAEDARTSHGTGRASSSRPGKLVAGRRPAAPPAPPPGAPRLLGDVIISLDTARQQARRARHRLADEVRLLLAHGLLHLLGHDHRTDSEERAMNLEVRRLVAASRLRTSARRGWSQKTLRSSLRDGV